MDVIFDIDGTLLDISHRLKFIGAPHPLGNGDDEHIRVKKKDWAAFRDPRQKRWDEPITPVIDVLKALYSADNRIIIASGRNKSEKEGTVDSLRTYIPFIDDIPMYMRSDKDFRKDTVVKSEMLDKMRVDGFDPVLVFDDRPSVIAMWHDRGLKVMDVRDPSKGNF